MIRVLLLIIGYCCGLLQTGYLYGKMNGIDIRSKGSGNSGATNTLRVLGKKAGLIVFLGDFLKSLIPCVIVRSLFGDSEGVLVYMLYMALGVILGHNYPCYLNFRGGKGIACTAGLILALDIRIGVVCLAAFIAVVAITRFVSLGSLFVTTINLIMAIIFWKIGWFTVGAGFVPEYVILLAVITALSYVRHRANIVRLMNGTENKIGQKKS
ncbi:MAG: glycerol-3-phosphate 1-O-acyltransferase PlsY [Lachnospiraceae bacterium]|nr:glycerol-3-phosphate 1-O-acyltransferase PlsY [Lachnospiraceae bacterium]